MFQLSDDLLDEDQIQKDQIVDIPNEQHYHSRKLFSNDENNEIDDFEFDLYLNDEQPIETTDEDLSITQNRHTKTSITFCQNK